VTLPLGTYYFQAIYSGNGSVAPARSACGSEVLTVATPPPPPPPCKCSLVKAFFDKVAPSSSTKLSMQLNIELVCTAGSGTGCESDVVIRAPAGAVFLNTERGKKKTTSTVTIHCPGPCNQATLKRLSLTWQAVKTTRHKHGKRSVTITTPVPSFLPHGRANHSKSFVVETYCREGSRLTLLSKLPMTLHFSKRGSVNYKKSDLNGDGRADGGQLNEF
jgi:hypothetical protein